MHNYLSFFLLLFLSMSVSFAIEEDSSLSTAGEVSNISLEQAKVLLESRSLPGDFTAQGGYVVRLYEQKKSADKDFEMQVNRTRLALENARKIRIENERAFGREPNIKDLEDSDARSLEDFKNKIKPLLARTTKTYAARYFVSGDMWREERMPLPDDVPLSELVKYVQEHGFKPNFIDCWNGHESAQLKRPLDVLKYPFANPDLNHGYSVLSYNAKDAPNVFSRAIQQIFTTERIDLLEKSGHQFQAQLLPGRQGDLIITMLPSDKDAAIITVTFDGPSGYYLSKSVTEIDGNIIHLEHNTNFIKTSTGFSIPRSLLLEVRSNKTFDVTNSIEHLAFERPQTGIVFDDALFNLASTEEFKSLPLDRSFLPQPPARIFPKKQVLDSSSTSEGSGFDRFWLVTLNIAFIIVVITIWLAKRYSISDPK